MKPKSNTIELTKELKNKFWSGVNPDDKLFEKACWVWYGIKGKKTTGKIFLNERTASGKSRKSYAVHRVSWLLHNGQIPDEMIVLHKLECSRKSCVNPNHLFLGNHRDCMDLMKQRGEHHVGERHGRSKLKEKDVLAIRVMHAEGEKTHAQLAKQFSVNVTNISFICRGITWKNSPGPLTKVKRVVRKLPRKDGYKTKFTIQDIRDIRKRYHDDGESSSKLSVEFNTTVTTVLAIANRKTHKSIL